MIPFICGEISNNFNENDTKIFGLKISVELLIIAFKCQGLGFIFLPYYELYVLISVTLKFCQRISICLNINAK